MFPLLPGEAMRIVTRALLILMFTAANQAADRPRSVKMQAGAPLQVISPSSQYDVPPKFIIGAAPSYPHTPLKLGAPGYAMISVTVDETGRTRDFRLWEIN